MKTIPKSKSSELVIQQSRDETLVYDLSINKAYCLNKTSSLVWKNCDGNNTVDDICNAITAESGISVDKDVVYLALDQLKTEGLLEEKEPFRNGFGGMSRREAIRRAGLTSAVALPVVSSIIAPKAVRAQSCPLLQNGQQFMIVLGQTCAGQAPANCCSGNADPVGIGTFTCECIP